MILRVSTWLLPALCACASTEPAGPVKDVGYNFERPAFTFVLPDTLREISGLTVIDSATFACVQDENGILFIYDAVNNFIKKQYRFNIDGDYEGICKVDETIYILRSDGTLFEIEDYSSPGFRLSSYPTGIPSTNNEGLCYDAELKRLLIACKGKVGKGPEYRDKRQIFAFDLGAKKLSKEPVFDFDVAELKKYAAENKVDLPQKTSKNVSEPVIRFRPSAICIHPVTKKLFLLSAADHMLFIFDMKGNIEHMQVLDPAVFNKSEGITFFDNGDMLITNEAQHKKPTLLRFNYKK
jgi:hypothetical protein